MNPDQLRDKTILITGWTGFIGGHLVSALRKIPGVRLVLSSRTCPNSVPDGAQWISGSLQDLTQDTWHKAGIVEFDVVFHLAGFISKTGADGNCLSQAYAGNLDGCRRLLESLPETTGRFVFTSTIDVYGPVPEGAVITEDQPTNPQTIYGASKLFCEHLVQIYCRQMKMPSSILRIGHIFGPGEQAYRKLIPEVIRTMLAGESPRICGQGAELRDFLFVRDAVEAILRSAVTDTQHLGPINIVRGESVPVLQVVETIVKLIDESRPVKAVTPQNQGCSFRFDAARMNSALGLPDRTSLTSLEDGLKEEIDYVKSSLRRWSRPRPDKKETYA